LDPKWRIPIAVAIVAVLVVAGVGTYYIVHNSSSGCKLQSTNPLVVDQAELVDTADPQVAFSTPDWGFAQQIYQTLVMYNGSSLTDFTGVLAKNWSQSTDGLHWNFTLNSGVHFSNGDPFNAYVMWYSLYRLLAMQGIDLYLLSENFWYPGVNYFSNWSGALANLTTDLNTFNFGNPSPSEVAIMSADNQSFRVLSPNEIQLNLGFGYNGVVPYAFLLAELATPAGSAVDPVVIDANGGVTSGPNTWMSTHAIGTGPYLLNSYSEISGYSLGIDPNYWANDLSKQQPWNNNIQPAQAALQVNYQSDPSVTVQDLRSGAVATASFAYLGPSTIHQLEGISCLTVEPLSPVFSGASGSWWVFMNQSVFPFNNLSVRAAITHSINYTQVIQDAFGGYAQEWVGPVPPGSPYYNPGNLSPYQYNPTLAQQEIQNSPCKNGACAHLNFNYEYLSTSTDWSDAATLIAADLAKINITVTPQGVSLAQFYEEQTLDPANGLCMSAETVNGAGPFYIGQDFYASDYISPDDWTQEDFLSYGSANQCQSGFNSYSAADYNYSLDALVLTAAGTTNVTQLDQMYAEMTAIQYQNYTNAWFAVPTLFAVYNPTLTGYYQTPMGSTELSTMDWNTIHAS
jgi:peptide/nickel transport system substrate-binding protein